MDTFIELILGIIVFIWFVLCGLVFFIGFIIVSPLVLLEHIFSLLLKPFKKEDN